MDAICDGEACNLEPATREEVMLKRLAEAIGSGGSGGSGGSSALRVWFDYGDGGLVTDVSPDKIYDAFVGGTPIIGIHENPDVFIRVYTLGGFDGSNNPYFYGVVDGKINTLTYNEDDDAYTTTTQS